MSMPAYVNLAHCRISRPGAIFLYKIYILTVSRLTDIIFTVVRLKQERKDRLWLEYI